MKCSFIWNVLVMYGGLLYFYFTCPGVSRVECL